MVTAMPLYAEVVKTPLKWPYGGEVVKERYGNQYLRFAPGFSLCYSDMTFDKGGLLYFAGAKFFMHSQIVFYKIEMADNFELHFENAELNDGAGLVFMDSNFANKSLLKFSGTKFSKGSYVSFINSLFAEGAIVDFGADFGGDKPFSEKGGIKFVNVRFDQSSIIFCGQEFAEGSNLYIVYSRFLNTSIIDLSNAIFCTGSEMIINASRFEGKVNFFDGIFNIEPNFENAYISGELSISGTKFNQGIDLRRTDLTKAKIYFSHHTYFPPGKLLVYWSQIKGHLYLDDSICQFKYTVDDLKKRKNLNKAGRDSLAVLEKQFDNERYDLTEIFYYRLRDNFLAQNDKASADGVMFELAEKRAEFLTEPLWILYGWTMGWGYKPVRFLVTVFCVIVLPFAWFWYRRYYHLILPQFDHSEDDALLKYQSGAKRDKLVSCQ